MDKSVDNVEKLEFSTTKAVCGVENPGGMTGRIVARFWEKKPVMEVNYVSGFMVGFRDDFVGKVDSFEKMRVFRG